MHTIMHLFQAIGPVRGNARDVLARRILFGTGPQSERWDYIAPLPAAEVVLLY